MIIGIDLGTTNSLAALWRDGAVELVPNALGAVLTPSAVSIGEAGVVLVGQAARDRLSTQPERSAASFKRAMGTDHVFELAGRPFRAEELSAFVLRSLKSDAERYLGEPVDEAVITVPAYFSNAQRRATEAAGQLAGLRVRRLLNEPTAAAMAYGLHHASDQAGDGAEERILVLDLGGGTFDVSILEVFEGVMEVRAIAGDNRLGGDDFTAVLMEGFMQAVGTAAGLPPLRADNEVRGALRRAAEVAKRALTTGHEHAMTLVHGGAELAWPVTRDGFEARAHPLLARLRAPIERSIRDARLSPDQISHLVLAGGATRMPMIRRMAAQLFDRLPIATVDPDEVVARGAAVQAGLAARDAALADRVMTDVAPFTLGVETSKGHDGRVLLDGLFSPLIERNTVIPASRSTTLSTVSDFQRRIALKVFQGEGRLVKDNIYLGELDVPVPPDKAGTQSVEVRFTYDTSGLLEVDALVTSTGLRRSAVIENQPGVLTAAEIAARLRKLAPLKVNPREQAENVAVIARVERLYSERLGAERDAVGAALEQFLLVLDRQDPAEIAAARQGLSDWLDGIDTSVF
jgi:molecular chaperone HscC